MKKFVFLAVYVLLCFLPVQTTFAGDHRIGGGANYWVTLDDIDTDEDIDDNGFSFYGSYQYWMSLIGLEIAAEFLPDRFGESAIAPQAYALVGKAIYAGIGIGTVYSDSEFADEPFFALGAGLNLEILPGIFAHIYGNYRFNDKADLDNESKDIDTDTIFLGAAIRIAL